MQGKWVFSITVHPGMNSNILSVYVYIRPPWDNACWNYVVQPKYRDLFSDSSDSLTFQTQKSSMLMHKCLKLAMRKNICNLQCKGISNLQWWQAVVNVTFWSKISCSFILKIQYLKLNFQVFFLFYVQTDTF